MSVQIPQITLAGTNLYRGYRNDKGQLCNIYTPLQNLSEETTKILGDFTTDQLEFDMEHPVDILLQDSYDGAVNMIINDGKNPSRLINSRFSVQDEGTFKIPDHTGFKDTNIYEESSFDVDTRLKSIPHRIPDLSYEGLIDNGGKLASGTYTFYFKLSDADGNETEVVAESGIVQCHIGQVNKPSSIRMGMQDENSSKAIHFTLKNIDSGFDYVHVLFSRTSSAEDQAKATTYSKVVFDYPITIQSDESTGDFLGSCDIIVTGAETIIGISKEECVVDYADIDSVKTQTVSNNVLLFGNITSTEHDWDAIRRFTWKIIPRVKQADEGVIGSITTNYVDPSTNSTDSDERGYCYYNTKNVYYRLGYWPEELYRFGIVYIFNDNSLSPIIDLQGIDLTITDVKKASDSHAEGKLSEYEQLFFSEDTSNDNRRPEYLYENEDMYFNKKYRTNSRGVIKFPKADVINAMSEGMSPRPLYINFDLSYIGLKYGEPLNNSIWDDPDNISWDVVLKKHKIKGFFFVRQKRVPTILGQGLIIGLSDKNRGSLPVIKSGGDFIIQSFLGSDRLLHEEAKDLYVQNKGQFSYQAMLVPEAEIKEATYNQLFVSNEFALSKIGSINFTYNSEDHTAHGYGFTDYANDKTHITKLLNIPEDTKILTNGTDFFSTLAGNPDEAYKTSDIEKEWRWTYPQDLTESTTLIRGKWGPYVGLSNPNKDNPTNSACPFRYGEVYNIKHPDFRNPDTIELYFLDAMTSHENFFAISHRMEAIQNVDCYRGDCYISMFTHRMFRNFVDPELPTNNQIVNPACWAENYGVRCTSVPVVSAGSNLGNEPEGWILGPKYEKAEMEKQMTIKLITLFLTGNIIGLIYAAATLEDELDKVVTNASLPMRERFPNGMANEVVQAFETYIPMSKRIYNSDMAKISDQYDTKFPNGQTRKRKVNPKEQEQQGGINLKAIFRSDDDWELHGLASINRADVNAVALGQWITFPICSNENLAMRDVDFSNATEQAAFNRKRSFYPLFPKLMTNPLRDSNVLNEAASLSVPQRAYYQLPRIPYFKQEYFTRIYNSIRDSANSITNEFKIMLQTAYRDYTKIYGSITKLEAWNNNVYVIFKHGIGVIPFTESSAKAENAEQFLSEMSVMSDKFGSIWKDSILKTDTGIYGVDTVAKVIWKIQSDGLNIISDTKVEKFLIDNIDMSEFTFRPYIGHINVKTHYNAFKHDVIFTYYNDKLYEFPSTGTSHLYGPDTNTIDLDGFVRDLNNEIVYDENDKPVKATLLLPYYKTTDEDQDGDPDLAWKNYSELIEDTRDGDTYYYQWVKGTNWSLCWNETVGMFQTFYDWIPLESENIDNIYFSFDRDGIEDLKGIKPWSKNIHFKQANGSDISIQLGINIKKSLIDSAFTNTTKYFVIKPTYGIYASIEDSLSLEPKDESNSQAVFSVYLKKAADNDTSPIITIYYDGFSVSKTIEDLGTEWAFVPIFIKNFGSSNMTITSIKIESASTFYMSEPKLSYTDENINYVEAPDYGINVKVEHPENGMFKKYYDIRSCDNSMKLWKHGQAGVFDNQGEIKPTNWYGKQHEFNFEFIVNENSSIQKIFNNLKIISNKTEPYKFEYEVVGEGYEWFEYKKIIHWINKMVKKQEEGFDTLENGYIKVLSTPYQELLSTYDDFPEIFYDRDIDAVWKIKKLPYFEIKLSDKKGLPDKDKSYTKEDNWTDIKKTDKYDAVAKNRPNNYKFNTSEPIIVEDTQLNEYRVHTESYGNNMKKYGRTRGNMEYLEDLWDVEIRPIPVKWVYVEDEELKSIITETRHRDKYIKIKIRYTGEDLAIIQAIVTKFDYSYA